MKTYYHLEEHPIIKSFGNLQISIIEDKKLKIRLPSGDHIICKYSEKTKEYHIVKLNQR
jgi:hypothetical protein